MAIEPTETPTAGRLIHQILQLQNRNTALTAERDRYRDDLATARRLTAHWEVQTVAAKQSLAATEDELDEATSALATVTEERDELGDALWECARLSGADLDNGHWKALKHPGVADIAIEAVKDMRDAYEEETLARR